MRPIKKLSDSTVNRIAAGEVVERPASVIKELVENSLDAGAKNISVRIESAGKNLISISDDGYGMSEDDMLLAIERHTTSKLQEDDISNILFFGFRGEALPSIASVSNLNITSRKINSDIGHFIKLSGGTLQESYSINAPYGTKIEVRDIFFSTPARLKFLKSDKTEQNACFEVIKRIAFAYPQVSFTLIADNKEIFKVIAVDSFKERLNDILGKEFIDNSANVELVSNSIKVTGLTTIPTYNRAASSELYLYVNNRPVKDKLLNIAVKVAYQDYLARDRYPVAVLFIEIPPNFVDVNVHPAKTEVRFRDSTEIRGLLISSIKDALLKTSHHTSTILSEHLVEKNINYQPALNNQIREHSHSFSSSYNYKKPIKAVPNFSNNPIKNFLTDTPIMSSAIEPEKTSIEENINNRLGAAIGQVHNTYIISQITDGMIIVDQHAAHERLVYEKIKTELLNKDIISQRLIIPIIVNLSSEHLAELLFERAEELAKLGLIFQKFGPKTIAVREIPALLGDFNVEKLILDLADNFNDMGENIALQELIEHVTETYACHYSIRSGRSMSIQEMNDLLREMENTPFSGQCNHGRPTYVKLNIADIERLFGRR